MEDLLRVNGFCNNNYKWYEGGKGRLLEVLANRAMDD
jgi:hypothetical protein